MLIIYEVFDFQECRKRLEEVHLELADRRALGTSFAIELEREDQTDMFHFEVA